MCIWLIHSAICMFYRCAERMIFWVSVLTSCHLCLHVVLSVPQYHLFSSTTSQRRGTDNTTAIAVFPVSYACNDLLPSVACYFSLFLTHIRHCCIFATANGKTENNPPPPLRSSHLSQGDSQLQPTSGHTSNSLSINL